MDDKIRLPLWFNIVFTAGVLFALFVAFVSVMTIIDAVG